MSSRARRYLERHGITLTVLVEEQGRSKTTWSRFLAGGRTPASGDARGDIEAVLTRRGIDVPADLWAPAKKRTNDHHEEDNGAIEMQAQALSQAAQKQWRLFMSPFDFEALHDPQTGDDRLEQLYLPVGHAFALARLQQAYLKSGFVALAGEPGSGKTTLNQLALRQASELREIVRVTPANIERRKMTATHIAAEIIRQLSEEKIPAAANRRDALAADVLLRMYQAGQRAALVIDEAHELPDTTIKDLKRYHEMTHGYVRLLAVILIGQTELAARFNDARNHKLREVIIRCQLVPLAPMEGNSAGYIAARFAWLGRDVSEVFEPAALDAIEQRLAVHRQQFPVLIGNVATAAMNIAARRGINDRVTDEDVESVWGLRADQLQEMGL